MICTWVCTPAHKQLKHSTCCSHIPSILGCSEYPQFQQTQTDSRYPVLPAISPNQTTTTVCVRKNDTTVMHLLYLILFLCYSIFYHQTSSWHNLTNTRSVIYFCPCDRVHQALATRIQWMSFDAIVRQMTSSASKARASVLFSYIDVRSASLAFPALIEFNGIKLTYYNLQLYR